jgi:hypothetical protein
MKLEIDLVPSTAWYSNLRTKIPKPEWDRLRKQCYADYGHKCGICGASGRLNCHEIWEYGPNYIQTLKGFIALCDDCHMIKHMGFAGIQAAEGKLDMERLIAHFMRVNGVDRKAFDRHEKEAFALWSERSEHQWKTDLSRWSNLVTPSSDSKPSARKDGIKWYFPSS